MRAGKREDEVLKRERLILEREEREESEWKKKIKTEADEDIPRPPSKKVGFRDRQNKTIIVFCADEAICGVCRRTTAVQTSNRRLKENESA